MLTLASGLTNSMRGAAFLTGVQNGIVIDIGGTTIHVGSISIFLSTTLFKTDVKGVNLTMTGIQIRDLIGKHKKKVFSLKC